MAERSVTEGVGKWRRDTPFPKDSYVLHCVEEKFEISKKGEGNPMLVRTWEIVSPETIVVGDRTLSIAGEQITQYLVCKVKNEDGEGWDTKKSDQSFSNLRDDLRNLGFDGTSIDDENPPQIAKGKTVDAIVYAKEEVQRKAPAPGQQKGEPIKVNGKEVKQYNLAILQIVGLSSGTKVDSAF